jgi:hypothetical protein
MDEKFNFCRMAIGLSPAVEKNAKFLMQEMEWLGQLIHLRLRLYFNDNPSHKSITEIQPYVIKGDDGTYPDFIGANQLTWAERILLALAMAPNIKPELLDGFFARNTTYDKKFSEFGGITTSNINNFIPTVETALFLLAGSDLKLRFQYYQLFDPNQFLVKSGVIELNDLQQGRSLFSSLLQVEDDYVEYFITGGHKNPAYNENFPAKLIITGLNWEDVVLAEATREGVEEVKDWIQHGKEVLMLTGLQKRLKPGYKSLFYGPPGTGKTLTAALLGKATNHDVYRIDISSLVSRYIGETEKNLAKVFDRAENKDWILFFDEADALFSKRTDVNSSNDRFANQEVAYLLQRIEDHNGMVILASNLKDNIDKAFLRRFQSIIFFPVPDVEERFLLWKNAFPENMQPSKEVDLYTLAEKNVLSGGSIVNVVRYCCLKAVKNRTKFVDAKDIEDGVRKELQKEGKII